MHTNANTSAPLPYVLNEQLAQLEILQNAFKVVLSSTEIQEANLPMLDVLYSLNERFSDLLKYH